MTDTTDSELRYLRALYLLAFHEGRYRRSRWKRSDLEEAYAREFKTLNGFKPLIDNLIFLKMIKIEVAPSGFEALYYLPKMTVEYLASIEPDLDIHDGSRSGLLASIAFNPANLQLLSEHLNYIEQELDLLTLTNTEKSMAKSYIVAAKLLADAPDPPIDIIWELVSRANNVCGIASLFVAILALFTAV